KRKRPRTALPVWGAAGVSLAMTGGASAAVAPTVDGPSQHSTLSPAIFLAEEEIADVSLATFYVYDQGSPYLGERLQLARGGCGGCGGCRGCGGGGGCAARGCAGIGGCAARGCAIRGCGVGLGVRGCGVGLGVRRCGVGLGCRGCRCGFIRGCGCGCGCGGGCGGWGDSCGGWGRGGRWNR